MTQWPPVLKTEAKVPRKLRAWKFTSDGPFWGGLLLFLIWASTCTVIVSAVAQKAGAP